MSQIIVQNKTPGRKPGTPNRKTEVLEEICAKNGLNPFEAMVHMAQCDAYEPALRFAALKELCQYLYPKRKALELSGDAEGGGIRIVVEDYTSKK